MKGFQSGRSLLEVIVLTNLGFIGIFWGCFLLKWNFPGQLSNITFDNHQFSQYLCRWKKGTIRKESLMVLPLSLGQGRERVLFIPHGDDVYDRRLLDKYNIVLGTIRFPHKWNAGPKMMTFDLNASSSILINCNDNQMFCFSGDSFEFNYSNGKMEVNFSSLHPWKYITSHCIHEDAVTFMRM